VRTEAPLGAENRRLALLLVGALGILYAVAVVGIVVLN
jgi:hypothetical protein